MSYSYKQKQKNELFIQKKVKNINIQKWTIYIYKKHSKMSYSFNKNELFIYYIYTKHELFIYTKNVYSYKEVIHTKKGVIHIYKK